MERPEELSQRINLMRQRRGLHGTPGYSASQAYVDDFSGDRRLRYDDDDDSSSWDHCVDEEEEVYHGQYIVRNLCVALSMGVEGLTSRYWARIITFQGKEAPGT